MRKWWKSVASDLALIALIIPTMAIIVGLSLYCKALELRFLLWLIGR